MKSESLVIANRNVAVNIVRGLYTPPVKTTKVSNTQSQKLNRKEGAV